MVQVGVLWEPQSMGGEMEKEDGCEKDKEGHLSTVEGCSCSEPVDVEGSVR